MSTGIIVSQLFHNRVPPEDYLSLLAAILAVFNLAGIIVIILVGSKASRNILAPIKAMTDAVREISFNQLDRRLEVSGQK